MSSSTPAGVRKEVSTEEMARHTQVVRDHIQRLRVMLHLRVQAGEVEPVEDVVLLDLAEVLVAFGGQEP